jgi:predicted O-linked N-acetylglucosamine transferase (SPINDLY family)
MTIVHAQANAELKSRPARSERDCGGGKKPSGQPNPHVAEHAWREGLRLSQAQRHAQARSAFARAVTYAPSDALYWTQLARTELQLGNLDACLYAAKQARRFADPRNRSFCSALIGLLEQVGDHVGVLDVLTRHAETVSADSLNATWHVSRCNALYELGRASEAVTSGMQAVMLSIEGDAASATERAAVRRRAALLLGHSLASLKQHADAAVGYRMAVDAQPLAIGSALYAAHYSAWMCDWPALQSDLQRVRDIAHAIDALPANAQPEDLSPFCLIGLSDDPALMRWASEHASVYTAARAPNKPRRNRSVPRPNGRLRIGLLSSDFHQHATSILIVQALEHIDRSRFELVFYSGGPDDGTSLRARVLATASVVHEVASLPARRIAELIEADQIGVLLDLKGFTKGARLDVLAARAAPLQVAWLGYPGTCGNLDIDYIIGDTVVTPLDNQADFTETIAQMPHCYQPNDGTRSRPAAWSRAECGLPEDAVVLASFNQAYKTTADMFAAWCEVLRATPAAVLWMLVPDADTQRRLRAHAERLGVASSRIVFAPFLDIEPHRARLPQADLVLDTFPCSGHTTASDALWAGVPVITLKGHAFASRVAASLLITLGLPELVCNNLDEYTERAIALARPGSELATLRRNIAAQRSASPLFDGRRYAADLCRLIDRMASRHDQGLPPTALAAEAGCT